MCRRAAAWLVVAGPGNNGGDGFVAARHLAERGYAVRRAACSASATRLKGDAAAPLQRWSGPIEAATPAALVDADLVIDALFGAGLDRAARRRGRAHDRGAERLRRAGARGRPAERHRTARTGAVWGLRSRRPPQVTFFRRKPGHLLLPGGCIAAGRRSPTSASRRRVLDTIQPQTFVNRPALWARRFPVPRPDGHKYSRGHAVVVSGRLATTGAARLAARGALRAGPGSSPSPPRRDALAVNAAASSRRHGARRGRRGGARRNSSPTRGATPSCSAPAAASARRCAIGRWRRSHGERPWCSTPTR